MDNKDKDTVWKEIKTKQEFEALSADLQKGIVDSVRRDISDIIKECGSEVSYDNPDMRAATLFIVDILNPDQILNHDTFVSIYDTMIQQSVDKEISKAVSGSYGLPSAKNIHRGSGIPQKHIKRYLQNLDQSDEFKEQIQTAKAAIPWVLSKLLDEISDGNMKAASIFFKAITTLTMPSKIEQINAQQNNYYQINNTLLHPDRLKELSAAQLSKIEMIINEKPSVAFNEQNR